MNDPKPIEYELETEEKPPETEAEALARVQRDEDALARRMGVMRPKGVPAGRRGIERAGGTNAMAMRLIEQEDRLTERKRQARAAAGRLVVGLVVLVVVLGGLGVLACDYFQVLSVGIFKRADSTTVVASAPTTRDAQVAVTVSAEKPKPGITVLGVLGESKPIDNPVSEAPPMTAASLPQGAQSPATAEKPERKVDPAELRRAKDRVASKQRGVDSIKKDLAERDVKIRQNIIALYGVVPTPRDAVPRKDLWQSPCAAVEQLQAYAAPKPANGSLVQNWLLRRDNADVAVRNLNNYLAADRKLEIDIQARLAKAQKELDQAEELLDAVSR